MTRSVLAVASGGGHWVQLLRLRQAFIGCDVRYVTTKKEYAKDINAPLYTVTDASIWEKLKLVRMFIEVAWVVLKVRPDIVITTGAAPGFAAIFFGKLLGAKTIWLDSIANSEKLSNSGKNAKRWADVWLTQWPHLSSDEGPKHWGGIL
jgi:UDP-N-acetylglucosamine:LPS N-acetylglucosamine transferase